jgi:hypothetical protein
MGDASYGNAMTEIALALAMGFFSIMVLAIMSMGASQSLQMDAAAGTPIKLTLAPPSLNNTSAKKNPAASKNQLIIFWQGRYFNKDLKPLDINKYKFKGRVILALSPDLPMSQALEARIRLSAQNIFVSTLDQRWLKTIGKAIGKE